MRFQQTQGTENSRRCRIRYSPCRLLQNNGVLKSVSTARQVSDNTALDTIPANRDFASPGELDPGRTISLN